jgi:two-component system, response regulator
MAAMGGDGVFVSNDKTILLVEDDPDHELLTLRALRKSALAAEVVVVRDGVEALDYLFASGAHAGRDTSAQPRLVLLDLTLPRLDGIAVLNRMRGDNRTWLVPVVVLTSSNEQDDVVKSYASGANAYVRKAVEFDRFVEAIRVLGLFWLVLNETAATQPQRQD